MIRVLFVVLALAIANPAAAQISSPVKWSYKATKRTDTSYAIVLTASMQAPWYIYSQNTGKGGPIPTSITFKANPQVMTSGQVMETGKLQKTFDKSFNMTVLYYRGTVQFTQIVNVKNGAKPVLTGSVEYMASNGSQTLPPAKTTFSLALR